MNNFEKLKKILEEYKIKFILHDLSDKLGDDELGVDEHVKALGMKYREGLSTMIYYSKGNYYALLRRDDRNVDLKKLQQITGDKRISFASEKELKELGFEPGLATPLLLNDLNHPVKVLADKAFLEMDRVVCGSTLKSTSLDTNKEDILKYLKGYEEVDTTVPNPRRQDISYSDDMKDKNYRVVSGITPSGSAMHIGNYFGMAKPAIELQDKSDAYLFIADLHALTTVQDSKILDENITNVVLDYLSLGLDPEKVTFFRQSDVPAHSQLAIVLGNYVSYGHMKRMHAFKDKLQKGANQDSINMGLFNYPILMAADILLYKPNGVPVGEDQRQHVEITRDMAESFNKAYEKEAFPLPEALISKETGKIIGTDGQRKMSKSLGNIIGIFEDEAVIKKQIMGSYTDPNRKKPTDPGKVEGNPVFIYHDLINNNKQEVEDLKKRYREGKVGDVEVKEKLFDAHMKFFEQARKKRKELEENLDLVKEILKKGAEKAVKISEETMKEVYSTIGIKNKLSTIK